VLTFTVLVAEALRQVLVQVVRAEQVGAEMEPEVAAAEMLQVSDPAVVVQTVQVHWVDTEQQESLLLLTRNR
jgi:hypothetical protein